jgi:arylesterase / paraoxonase
MRWLDVFGYASGSIGYCHINEGCKFAATGIHGANGIVKAKNSTDVESYYVANSLRPKIYVFERELDNTFVLVETIATG